MATFNALLFISVVINLQVDQVSPPGESRSPKQAESYDCGLIALSDFLALQGTRVLASEIEALLPKRDADGYSMKELRDVARQLGSELQGILLPREESAIDRPMIAYVKRGGVGHYLVIRPVGPSGRLVQIIDNSGDPEVVDKKQVLASANWTGLVLVPPRASKTLRNLLAGMVLVVCVLLLSVRTIRRLMTGSTFRAPILSDLGQGAA